ncbi:MAG: F0F1 ATP synthase subunit A [Bacteroidales bacterium]|nr:F0F1 ATP synthase subunit A [Bacteroidales bacterium]
MRKIVAVFVSLLLGTLVFASKNETNPLDSHHDTLQAASYDAHADGHKTFEPGTFIFDHIKDSYDWHLFSMGHKHVSVALPIILFSKQNGLVMFMYSKLHHGHQSYLFNGFEYKVAQAAPYQGKIVEIDPHGILSRPLDFSITKNAAALFFSAILILVIFLGIAKKYKRNPIASPKGSQSLFEPIIIFIRDDIAKPSIGHHHYEKYTPFLLTLFFFIWVNNMLGLIPIIPGGANVTGNIAVTLVLALFTFVITTINGNKTTGCTF